jgi:hypothetical protein
VFKKLLSFICMLLAFTIIGTTVSAFESTDFRYFVVSADITKSEDGTYHIVKTKGAKENEGIVFTPEGIEGGEKLSLSLDLKGTGSVFIKIEETDARGTFIKEITSAPIILPGAWQTVQLDTTLSPQTKQIDIMVLTPTKSNVEFSFRDVTLKK